jgi:hypothetical protein
MKLAEVEARFYALVTARESVAAEVAARGPAARRELEAWAVGDARLSAVERLDIYANMYFFRIRDVLAEEHPRTAAALGADAFHNLVTDYLAACRPDHPSLREVGARLPAFLAAHPLGEARPWLAEVARLERTHLELFDGPDAAALSVEALRRTPPERLGGLALRLGPCHALLDNRFRVAAPTTVPEQGPETLFVWRRELEVFHRAVDSDEAAWLRRLAPGISFEALCEELGRDAPDDVAAARALALVGRLAADGALRAPEHVAA